MKLNSEHDVNSNERGRAGARGRRLMFESIPIGGVKNVAYIVGDAKTRVVAVVDAGYNPKLILERVSRLDATVKYILATHRHRDHTGAVAAIKQATGAPLAAYKTVPGVDVPLGDLAKLWLDKICIDVIYTPGHTLDSVCFLVDGHKLLTGDTLYVGKVSKGPNMRAFFDSLHNRLMKLPDTIEVWPGHNVGIKPSSTIGEERRSNPILKMSFEAFCDRRWDRENRRWAVPRIATRARSRI